IWQKEKKKHYSVLVDTKHLPQSELKDKLLPHLQTSEEPSNPQQREMIQEAQIVNCDRDR
ncbi:elongation factor G, partial [Enterococcus faecalis]